jgi:hypothetical protein
LTIKLHIDIEHLVGYSKIVYQIMHGMMMMMIPVKYGIVLKLNEHEILIPV